MYVEQPFTEEKTPVSKLLHAVQMVLPRTGVHVLGIIERDEKHASPRETNYQASNAPCNAHHPKFVNVSRGALYD